MTEDNHMKHLESDKILVIDVFSRGCYYCWRFSDVWNDLHLKYKNHKNIFLMKLDGSENSSLMETFYVSQFPTLLLLRASDRKFPVHFQGYRTVDFMSKWIESFAKDDLFVTGAITKDDFLGKHKEGVKGVVISNTSKEDNEEEEDSIDKREVAELLTQSVSDQLLNNNKVRKITGEKKFSKIIEL